MGSFKELHAFQKAREAGLIQIVTPEQQAQTALKDSIEEVGGLWTTRLQYALALIQSGRTLTPEQVMAEAEALAKLDHADRCRKVLDLHAIHGAKVPEALKYAAHIVGVEVAEKTEDKPVNLHG